MGATTGLWGTVRMQLAFRPAFQFMNMKALSKPEVLVAQAQHKFNEQGELTDATSRELVKQQLIALRDLALQYKRHT